MLYRYTYKITCTKGSYKDKFYFGRHTTNNLDDNYKGSGKLLKQYYKKYPNAYIKEILGFYDNIQELDKAEYNLIHPFLGNSMCLNLVDGGTGSHKGCTSPRKGAKLSEETKRKISEKNKGKKLTEEQKYKIHLATSNMSEETKKKMSQSKKGHNVSKEARDKISKVHKGKIVNKEVRDKISNTLKGNTPANKGMKMSDEFRHKKSENSKNRKWLTDGYLDYFVKPEFIGELIDIGFYFGRSNYNHI